MTVRDDVRGDAEAIWRRARALLGDVAGKTPETLSQSPVLARIVWAVAEVARTTSPANADILEEFRRVMLMNLEIERLRPRPVDEVASRFAGIDMGDDDAEG